MSTKIEAGGIASLIYRDKLRIVGVLGLVTGSEERKWTVKVPGRRPEEMVVKEKDLKPFALGRPEVPSSGRYSGLTIIKSS